MSIDPSTFETILASRYITFTLPNSYPYPQLLHTPLLRVAVLDSPTTITTTTQITAMLVPLNRESDWIFSTETGHLQLLLTFPHLSRLILIGNLPNCPHPISFKPHIHQFDTNSSQIETSLRPLLLGLSPRSAFSPNGNFPEIPFLSYEDDVVQSVVLEICEGSFVGEMLVEDVELKFSNGDKDFRRRLRFKRMPNLVQTQMRIDRENELKVDDKVLVQPYLNPMVAGLSVIGSYLDGRFRDGLTPKALCLGVGGGALIGFLSSQLGFEVHGVEEDEAVLRVGRKYFSLGVSELVHLCVEDGIILINKMAQQVNNHGKFDVIMIDLDSSDVGMGSCAPPLEFVKKSVIKAARVVVCESGVVVVNVIPPSKSFYEMVVAEFFDVFEELYEIDVGNEENFVLVASVSKTNTAFHVGENGFLIKLRGAISGDYLDSIRKISRSNSYR